jgi:hypothetical protein
MSATTGKKMGDEGRVVAVGAPKVPLEAQGWAWLGGGARVTRKHTQNPAPASRVFEPGIVRVPEATITSERSSATFDELPPYVAGRPRRGLLTPQCVR